MAGHPRHHPWGVRAVPAEVVLQPVRQGEDSAVNARGAREVRWVWGSRGGGSRESSIRPWCGIWNARGGCCSLSFVIRSTRAFATASEIYPAQGVEMPRARGGFRESGSLDENRRWNQEKGPGQALAGRTRRKLRRLLARGQVLTRSRYADGACRGALML